MYGKFYIGVNNMNEIDMITKRLKQAIADSGYSYAQLEKKTGIPKSTLQRWATGQIKRIPIDDIVTIADAIGISAKWIMGWQDEPTAPIPDFLTESQIKLLQLLPNLNEDDLDDLLILANSKAARHTIRDDSE